MINKLLYFIIFTFIFACQSKKDLQKVKNKIEVVLPPFEYNEVNNIVGFACYESGNESKAVALFSKFLGNKNYEIIKNKLENTWPAEKYLATLLCEELAENNLITLSARELLLIKKNKSSKEFVGICSGCSGASQLTLKALFLKDKRYFLEEFNQWFNTISKN